MELIDRPPHESRKQVQPSAAPMDTTEATQPYGSSPACYPQWVMLERWGDRVDDEDSPCFTTAGDAANVAAAASTFTSAGHPIRLSFRLAPPPAPSCLCVHFPPRPDGTNAYPAVVAAHGDSVLIQIGFQNLWDGGTADAFVYTAGAGPSRPPSLSLFPPYYDGAEPRWWGYGRPHRLDKYATGLLRRGGGDGDELVVAELRMTMAASSDGRGTPSPSAQLLLLRSGEWSVVRAPISIHEAGDDKSKSGELRSWHADAVVPAGDRALCWVDLSRGVILSDDVLEAAAGGPTLRYAPLPVKPRLGCRKASRDVCAAGAGAGAAVRFVEVSSSCGGVEDATYCHRSCHPYAIRTWTLRTDAGGGGGGGMAWVMDGRVDAGELWALDAYGGLPRVQPDYPVLSMDDSDAICFMVCEGNHVDDGDKTEWLITVDVRRKTLRSVSCYPEGRLHFLGGTPVPSRVSNYMNSISSKQ